jgi:hypothetical protein
MAKYIIQKAVEPAKVKKGLLDPLSSYLQQAKYDGCCAILIFREGEFRLAQSRTGEAAQSMDRIGRSMEASGIFRDVAVIGEAWRPGKGIFNEISGDFRRHSEINSLQFIINDVIPLADFEAGLCLIGYADRRRSYRDAITRYATLYPDCGFSFAQEWGAGTGDPHERCQFLVGHGGYDGLILRKYAGTWKAGSGTTGEILKLKQKLSFDLRVLEVNTVTGAKTGRDVHKLVVDFRGKPLGVGSGLPFKIEDCPKVGDIVEVEAMDHSSDGLLREPRFKGIRHDKLETD